MNMNIRIACFIGAVAGVLDGVGIFYAPEEPYKAEIFFAAILKGVIVALMTGFALQKEKSSPRAIATGILYGFLFALVIFLAKGGIKSMDAPFVVPSGVVMGALTGFLVNRFALPKN
jgi:hypothetical protein